MTATAAGLQDATVRDCAGRLAAAERSRTPIPPLTTTHPGLTLAQAYRVQQLNIARRTDAGERIVGHKVGLTARTMQELFGVDEPDYGHLLDTMMRKASEPFDLSELIDPQIEVEPAFVLGRKLQGPGLGIAEVMAAIDHVCVCFEIIDSRIIDWQIRIQDTVADNGSSARVVLGAQRVEPSALALDDLDASLELDGAIVERGNTSAVLGHPAASAAWLANTLAGYGIGLEPGDLILPGTCMRSRRIALHQRATGTIAGLGEVSIDLVNAPTMRR